MVVGNVVFLVVLGMYLFLMSTIGVCWFSEKFIGYSDMFNALRITVDIMMGVTMWENYSHPVDKLLYVFFLVINVYIANIFLLNYLVAILSTVYDENTPIGLFEY